MNAHLDISEQANVSFLKFKREHGLFDIDENALRIIFIYAFAEGAGYGQNVMHKANMEALGRVIDARKNP